MQHERNTCTLRQGVPLRLSLNTSRRNTGTKADAVIRTGVGSWDECYSDALPTRLLRSYRWLSTAGRSNGMGMSAPYPFIGVPNIRGFEASTDSQLALHPSPVRIQSDRPTTIDAYSRCQDDWMTWLSCHSYPSVAGPLLSARRPDRGIRHRPTRPDPTRAHLGTSELAGSCRRRSHIAWLLIVDSNERFVAASSGRSLRERSAGIRDLAVAGERQRNWSAAAANQQLRANTGACSTDGFSSGSSSSSSPCVPRDRGIESTPYPGSCIAARRAEPSLTVGRNNRQRSREPGVRCSSCLASASILTHQRSTVKR